MTTAGYVFPSTKTKLSYRGSSPGVDLDTGGVTSTVRPLVAKPIILPIAGYDYSSTTIAIRYQVSTHSVDPITGCIRQLAAMTIVGHEYTPTQ